MFRNMVVWCIEEKRRASISCFLFLSFLFFFFLFVFFSFFWFFLFFFFIFLQVNRNLPANAPSLSLLSFTSSFSFASSLATSLFSSSYFSSSFFSSSSFIFIRSVSLMARFVFSVCLVFSPVFAALKRPLAIIIVAFFFCVCARACVCGAFQSFGEIISSVPVHSNFANGRTFRINQIRPAVISWKVIACLFTHFY